MMVLHRTLARHWQLLLPMALCLALSGVIYVETGALARATVGTYQRRPAPLHEPPNFDHAVLAFAFPPLESLAEVVKRPLFIETRRLPRPSGNAPSQPPSGLALVGAVLSNGAARALIEHGEPARLERATEGDDVEGWTVESIALDRVVLQRAGLRAELRMNDAPPSATGKPAAMTAVVSNIRPPDDLAAEHATAVQAYMDAHGGMLPPDAQ
jgi:hypothetical protein